MPVPALSEYDLAEFVRCPLRPVGSNEESAILTAVSKVLQILLIQVFDGEDLSQSTVRKQLEIGGVRLKEVPRIARRLQELWYAYTIRHPVTPYELHFGRNLVRGEYAVMALERKEAQPLIVRLRYGISQAEAEQRGPDVISLCRWLHFRSWESTLPMARVLNWSVDTNEHWMEFYDEKVVRQYLESISKIHAGNLLYPSPGPYCESCSQPNCFSAREEFSTSWMR